ncbi:Rossman fold protein, TIGR00730 family [Comamonas serinivorans]|uniref:Cytokinin riboside 5'-monophosphate phosphoribohydrolase n=1 Tax=Comamonas serinivorans TaxID=1082851 RepID=A0A1Y0EM17_9BURK|nr:TIGR00730 family Rossman fold protein [Comamonas serinivorans]ARU04647.1 Rossman fold protein, TIGR00730 family [Comamonas serinivorans]
METTQDIKQQRLADAWAELQAQADEGVSLQPDSNRLAFADPEFLLRVETRGIRFQLELLKPELGQQAAGIHHTIVVYGSARLPSPERANELATLAGRTHAPADIAAAKRAAKGAARYEQARAFGRLVAEFSKTQPDTERVHICTGGGPGIMEAANRGAYDAGMPTVGLNITLPHEQNGNPYITPGLSFKFHYFALRKMHFMMRAKALVVFPGGFGTLDELFEVTTLVQTHKAKRVPIVLFGSDFWGQLINFKLLVEEGMISPEDVELMTIVDTPEAAWEAIRSFYELRNDAIPVAA